MKRITQPFLVPGVLSAAFIFALWCFASGCTSVSSGQHDIRKKRNITEKIYDLDEKGRTNRITVRDVVNEDTGIRTRGHAYAAGSSGQNIKGFTVQQDEQKQGFGLKADQKSELDKTIESAAKLRSLMDSFQGRQAPPEEFKVPSGFKLVPKDDPSVARPEISTNTPNR